MKRGVVHSKDKSRTYITAHHSTVKKDKHAKHLFPGKGKKKIIPAKKKKHHSDYTVGDKVHFEIHPKGEGIAKFFYHGLPLFGIIVGFIVGIITTDDEVGILILTGLFMLLAMNIRAIIRTKFNIFREIDVHIVEPIAKVQITKAKKRRKAKKKK